MEASRSGVSIVVQRSFLYPKQIGAVDMSNWIKSLTFVLCLICATTLSALASEPDAGPNVMNQPKPAVDGINGKFSIEKDVTDEDLVGGTGSLTIPLGHQFGLQLDGHIANAGDSQLDIPIYAGVAHLFWRDPDKGMVGLYGGTMRVDVLGGLDFHAGALEFAKYWPNVTLKGLIGFTEGDIVDASFLEHISLAYYMTDNLRVDVSHSFRFDHHVFHAGGEWAFGHHRGAATSMFVESSMLENGDASALLGLRLYLGQSEKSLIRRHREDDPEDELESWSSGIGTIAFYFLQAPELDFDLTNLRNILDIDYCQHHPAKCAAFANQ